jgi:putative phage-type endonuclease
MSDFWDIHEDAEEPVKKLKIIDVGQGTEEWLALRAGLITGSRISDVMAGGAGIIKEKYRVQLAIERITKKPVPMDFKSSAMIKGNDDEPLAREHYEFMNDVDTEQVGFVFHPTLSRAGASPDSLVGDDGLLEIKCPNMGTHVNYLLSKKIPKNYLDQMQWQMACTGRQWCDWVTFCKEMPIHLRVLIIRVNRDEQRIAELEQAAFEFDGGIEQLIIKLGALK